MSATVWRNAINQYGERIQFLGSITLNLDYWDCECLGNYIHPITQLVSL